MVELDGERLRLQLLDTAGQERFRRSITHHYYRLALCYATVDCTALYYFRNASAVVFVYDVNSAASLVALESWLQEVLP